jgi:hypothetical protein
MFDIDYQQVILWVLIVLAAGFIGQFGKSFATYLISLARKKKNSGGAEKSGSADNTREEGKSPADVSETATRQAKTEKKALKAMIKEKKKQS